MPKKKSDDSKDKYDNAAKIVFQERPMDVIQFATGYTSPTIEPLRTSLEIRRRREVDTLAKIKIPSEKNPKRLIYVIAHVEFQTEPMSIMPYRCLFSSLKRNCDENLDAEYKARLLRVYRIPVISTVIYFREKKSGKKDMGIFEQKYPQRFLAEYNVIRLWELNGEEALRDCTPGSMPFIPLTAPPEGCSREEWLSKCVSVAHEITPREHLPNLLFSMSVLSGLVIPDTDTIETIIPEEIMKESVFYQHIVNKARAEGLAEGLTEGKAKGKAKGKAEGKAEGRIEGESLGIIEALLALIRNRFTSVPRTILRNIRSIRDKETLLSIQKLAIDAKTKNEFVEAFNTLNI